MAKSGPWFTDVLSPFERHQHRLGKTLVRARTPFQKVLLADSPAFGRCLILDDEIQSAQKDEFIYHECLVHPAMALHARPQRVLILGGGEGATAREVLRYSSVRGVTMVDIDGDVVAFCRKYLAPWHQGAFSDPRLRLCIQDAAKFIRENESQFDIIISDLPTPSGRAGPLAKLYSADFYRRLAERLGPGGVLVTQAGSGSFADLRWMADLHRRLKTVFKTVRPYSAFVPSFDVPWGFLLASQKADPSRLSMEQIDRRLGTVGRELRFYDGQAHVGLFQTPKYMRTMLK